MIIINKINSFFPVLEALSDVSEKLGASNATLESKV